MDDHTSSIVPSQVEMTAPDPDGEAMLHPMVRAVLATTPTVETVRAMLDIQREYEADEARKRYTRAMVWLKNDLPSVLHRDKTVAYGQTRYTHTSLAAAVDQITPILGCHGFSKSWLTTNTERLVTVTCRLTHADGHSEETSLTGPPDNGGKKSPIQAIASSVTLLQRYTLLALLGIATGDMAEPTGERRQPSPASVDVAKNLVASTFIRKSGRSVDDAEALVGRGVAEWTAADIGSIRNWLRTAPESQPEHVEEPAVEIVQGEEK